MSSPHYSPFTRRLQKHLDEAGFAKTTLADASAIQRAFVAALKEEVEAALKDIDTATRPTFEKPPARRLVFTAKWEEIK